MGVGGVGGICCVGVGGNGCDGDDEMVVVLVEVLVVGTVLAPVLAM